MQKQVKFSALVCDSTASAPIENYGRHGRRKGRNCVLHRFQQLRSYHDEIEIRNREEIPFSSLIVPRGLSFAEGPYTALHNVAHLYRNQANALGGPAES